MPERYDYSPRNLLSLEQMTVMVTGAGGQLGAGMVCGLLDCGARVLACDVTVEAVEKAAVCWEWDMEHVLAVAVDVRERTQISNALDAGIERFGAVEGLVNNAGVSVFEPWLERTEESIDWVMDVNIKGTILCTQEFVKRRVKDKGGAVVNVASHYGFVSPDPRIYTDCDRKNSEIYGASKAGIIQLTRYVAVHGAEHGVRANAVAPGGVRNPDAPQGEDFQKNYGFRCPMGRMAETHEVVGAVLFLLSPAASYINGQTLPIDGGMTSW